MVPVEESPQEEDLDGDVMVEDEGSFRSNAGVSSTAVSPEPILIPAPVRDSVHLQKAVRGCGTKDCPYDLDFTLSVRRSCGIPPTGGENQCPELEHCKYTVSKWTM